MHIKTHLLDVGVEPADPARLALLGRLAVKQRGDATPLVLTILHHSGFQDLILRWGMMSMRSQSLDEGIAVTSTLVQTPPTGQKQRVR